MCTTPFWEGEESESRQFPYSPSVPPQRTQFNIYIYAFGQIQVYWEESIKLLLDVIFARVCVYKCLYIVVYVCLNVHMCISTCTYVYVSPRTYV